MENNMLKDLFNLQRYNEVIDILRILYSDLYVEMLDYKKDIVEEEYHELSYFQLSALICKYYPKFSNSINILEFSSSNPELSYLDVINTLLSTYLNFKDNYKNHSNDNIVIDNSDYIDEDQEDIFIKSYNDRHKNDTSK